MNDSRAMIRFPGAFGNLLAARLDLPPAPARAFALFVHCFTCSKDTLAAWASRYIDTAQAQQAVAPEAAPGSVTVTGSRDGRIDRIEREIDITGELDGEQHARLPEIADKCPVHRTPQSEVWIPTRLKTE